MIFSEKALIFSGAESKVYKKKDFIFQDGEQPRYYFQILQGNVYLNNYQEDGKEFIQIFFTDGDSIHESSLFDESLYTVNAVADSDCIIYRLDKLKFFDLIDTDSNIKDLMNINSAKAIKFLMAKNIIFKDPIVKVLHIINLLKIPASKEKKYELEVPYTRQQLASVTGLCVETVIRVVKKIRIERKDIYFERESIFIIAEK